MIAGITTLDKICANFFEALFQWQGPSIVALELQRAKHFNWTFLSASYLVVIMERGKVPILMASRFSLSRAGNSLLAAWEVPTL